MERIYRWYDHCATAQAQSPCRSLFTQFRVSALPKVPERPAVAAARKRIHQARHRMRSYFSLMVRPLAPMPANLPRENCNQVAERIGTQDRAFHNSICFLWAGRANFFVVVISSPMLGSASLCKPCIRAQKCRHESLATGCSNSAPRWHGAPRGSPSRDHNDGQHAVVRRDKYWFCALTSSGRRSVPTPGSTTTT